MPLSVIEQLHLFKMRDKFSFQAWNERGLIMPDKEISHKLTLFMNETVDEILAGLREGKNSEELKRILKRALPKFKFIEGDTEFKEFIAELFYEISQILNLNFSNQINEWLYGKTITALSTLLKKKTVAEDSIQQKCVQCETQLTTLIVQKQEGIPERDWMIIQCNSCKAYNLLNLGSNIKQIEFVNYKLIESLPRKKFTVSDAELRLKQVQTFRSN